MALYGQPTVNVVCWDIIADCHGPSTPGRVIMGDEDMEIIKASPRIGFLEQTTDVLCGLCKTKPETTYDNFVCDFSRAHVDGYPQEWEKRRMDGYLAAAVGDVREVRGIGDSKNIRAMYHFSKHKVHSLTCKR
jgi:hypothetical protein